jgi:hypothetical protein
MSSFKNIAIPPRGVKRNGRWSDEARQPYAPATGLSAPGRLTLAEQRHRFAVGQRLAMAPGGREISRGASTCSVVFLLPYEGGPLRYRVRSDSESFERIVDENDLSELPNEVE